MIPTTKPERMYCIQIIYNEWRFDNQYSASFGERVGLCHLRQTREAAADGDREITKRQVGG